MYKKIEMWIMGIEYIPDDVKQFFISEGQVFANLGIKSLFSKVTVANLGFII
jgi:hypothetical protein